MDEDEDEELSELDSNDELGNDLDDGNDEEDEELDSDEDDSRSVTPDITKLTKRQRGALEDDPALMALSNEALKKKELTAEEHVQRRAEMARRRKNLSEKRNEEEKVSFRHWGTSPHRKTSCTDDISRRWKPSTNFCRNRLPSAEPAQKSMPPMPRPRKKKVRTRRVGLELIRSMSDGCRIVPGVTWVFPQNGWKARLVKSLLSLVEVGAWSRRWFDLSEFGLNRRPKPTGRFG
jgi:hypothetical protein